MKAFNTTATQTVEDAIAFGEYLLEINPNCDPSFLKFLRTQNPKALLNSEEININWFNEITKSLTASDRH